MCHPPPPCDCKVCAYCISGRYSLNVPITITPKETDFPSAKHPSDIGLCDQLGEVGAKFSADDIISRVSEQLNAHASQPSRQENQEAEEAGRFSSVKEGILYAVLLRLSAWQVLQSQLYGRLHYGTEIFRC